MFWGGSSPVVHQARAFSPSFRRAAGRMESGAWMVWRELWSWYLEKAPPPVDWERVEVQVIPAPVGAAVILLAVNRVHACCSVPGRRRPSPPRRPPQTPVMKPEVGGRLPITTAPRCQRPGSGTNHCGWSLRVTGTATSPDKAGRCHPR